MGRSLQLKLFAVAALAVVAALVAAWLFTRQAARVEFRRFEVTESAAHIQGLAELLAARLAKDEGLEHLNARLAELRRSDRRELVLIGPDGAVLGASTPELASGKATLGPGDRLTFERSVRRGNRTAHAREVLVGGPRAEVKRADGTSIGTLIALPPPQEEPLARPLAFGAAFDRRLMLAAAVSGLVALALAWLLSRRILEPVGALTDAARRLGRGDLAQRVTVRSRDEIGELSQAFNTMADSLARQEALRRTLVTDVAHELRTPLTNLRGQIEAVEDGLVAPSAETLRSLGEEVRLLAHLVDDLQTLSVAQDGGLALERAPLDVRDLVNAAIESLRSMAAEHRLTLCARVPKLPEVSADPMRIGQVLRNLLANAITHTPAGGTVEASARVLGDTVEIAVADTGSGIPPEHLAQVFERFYRADPSRARATGGAGLGLAIVKSLVEAHGGTVAAESPAGAGATFRFTLPRA
jgi:signal transduction histidine kinase